MQEKLNNFAKFLKWYSFPFPSPKLKFKTPVLLKVDPTHFEFFFIVHFFCTTKKKLGSSLVMNYLKQ
jgi:hypothetical protein